MSYGAWAGSVSEYRTLDIDPRVSPDIIADITKYNSSETFDIVICSETLEHVFDIFGAMDALRALTKGLLVVSVPFNYPIHPAPSDYWRVTPFALDKLMDGFELRQVTSLLGEAHTWGIATNDPERYGCFFQ
jgi:hypothetical protein